MLLSKIIRTAKRFGQKNTTICHPDGTATFIDLLFFPENSLLSIVYSVLEKSNLKFKPEIENHKWNASLKNTVLRQPIKRQVPKAFVIDFFLFLKIFG